MHNLPTRRGFTLLETLIVMALLTVLLGLVTFTSLDSLRGFSFRSERDTIVSLLQRARSHSINNINQTSWGLCQDPVTQTYVLFRGSYIAGAPTNETQTMSPNVFATTTPPIFLCSAGGITFTALSATTSSTTIELSQNGRASTVSINYEGTINW